MFEYSSCSKRIFKILHLPVHISNLILPSLIDLEIDAIIGCCKSHCLQGNKEIKTLLSCVFALAVDTYFRCCRRVSVALSLCLSVSLFVCHLFSFCLFILIFSHSSLIFRCVCLLISKCLLKTLKLKYELDFGICFSVSPFFSVSLLFSCCCRCFSPA